MPSPNQRGREGQAPHPRVQQATEGGQIGVLSLFAFVNLCVMRVMGTGQAGGLRLAAAPAAARCSSTQLDSWPSRAAPRLGPFIPAPVPRSFPLQQAPQCALAAALRPSADAGDWLRAQL